MVLEFYVLATKVFTFSFDFLPKPYFTSWCWCGGDSGCVLVVVVCSVMVAVRRQGFSGLSLAAKGLRRGSGVDCFSGAAVEAIRRWKDEETTKGVYRNQRNISFSGHI
ncbi:hypothetical protein Hanom_Chr05g00439151 [Helianthus anomalus]